MESTNQETTNMWYGPREGRQGRKNPSAVNLVLEKNHRFETIFRVRDDCIDIYEWLDQLF
jgi:hypothetical protein